MQKAFSLSNPRRRYLSPLGSAGAHLGIVLALCCLGATFAVASFRTRNVDSYE